MSYADQFSLESIRHILSDISSLARLKLLLSAVAVSGQWVFGQRAELVLVIAALILIDTVTGVAKGCQRHQLSSREFFRFSTKSIVYLVLLATASLVDKAIPFPFALAMIGTFLSVTEGISILENIGQMGYAVPTGLLKRLRVIQEEASQKEE